MKTLPARNLDRGSAVVLFIVLLGVMLALVAANGKTLSILKKDLQSIERRQAQRLQGYQTNAPNSVVLEAASVKAVP